MTRCSPAAHPAESVQAPIAGQGKTATLSDVPTPLHALAARAADSSALARNRELEFHLIDDRHVEVATTVAGDRLNVTLELDERGMSFAPAGRTLLVTALVPVFARV